MAREWFHGSGRFSVHGLRWPGESDTVEALDPVDPQSQRAKEAAVSASEVNRYTQDEELAMGQFVLHQEDNGKPVTRGSWATFAEVVSIFRLDYSLTTGRMLMVSTNIVQREHGRSIGENTKIGS